LVVTAQNKCNNLLMYLEAQQPKPRPGLLQATARRSGGQVNKFCHLKRMTVFNGNILYVQHINTSTHTTQM